MNNDHADDRRESRLHAFDASLTASDRAKAQTITAAAREALGRVYGSRLSELSVNRVVENILLTGEATISIKSPLNQLPTTREGWDAFVKNVSKSDTWVQANLISSDAKLREELRAECLDSLPAGKKMHLYRTGDLDGFVKNWIAARIQERMDLVR